jgi:hypothetical protein
MNQQLWNSILQFDLDNPTSEYGFSTRLASENFWAKNFTETAILEYKKFMYLAATSDFMVSPSAIVDTVWHQHLIFTQSYTDFCEVLGKQIQHIPSTHNRNEFEKFRQAKERTQKFYTESFGEQPKEIWDYSDMYDSLELPKARLKIRSFILIGILLFAATLPLFYFLLRPVFIQIGNPEFVLSFIVATVCIFSALEIFNRNYLAKTMMNFDGSSFVKKLNPLELVYLKTQNLSNVIHGTINRMVDGKAIVINADYMIQHSSDLKINLIEEHQVLDTLHNLGKTNYQNLLRSLLTKPIFRNITNSMKALGKYHVKSKSFGLLFYTNFAVLGLLLMSGTIRLYTGLLRDKPIAQISIALLALAIFIIAYLWRLTNIFSRKIIPGFYKNEVSQDDYQWQYFLMGNAVLATSFIPLVDHF